MSLGVCQNEHQEATSHKVPSSQKKKKKKEKQKHNSNVARELDANAHCTLGSKFSPLDTVLSQPAT